MKQLLVLVFFSLALAGSTKAQILPPETPYDTTRTYRLELMDGTQLIGKIEEQSPTKLVFSTASIKRLELAYTQIKSLSLVDALSLKRGEYYFPNPHATRYLFSPAAYTLKKGEGYYQNTYLVVNAVNYGLTDHISIGGGLELISTFGAGEPIFFITPKIGYAVSERVNLGGGLLYASVPSDGRTSLGVAYGIGTYGTPDHNATLGLGWGFVEGGFQASPLITISGITRIAKKTALLTENWLVPLDGYYGIFSYGIRFFGENMAVDLAFVNNPDIAQGIAIGIPYVDFVVKF